jgi:membrane protease YdiL (CAAX protease family)
MGNTTADRQSPEIRVSIALVMLFQVSALIIRSFVQVKMVESGFDAVIAKHLSALVGFAVLSVLMWPIMVKVWPAIREQFRRPASWTRMFLASVTLGVALWLGQMLALLGYSIVEWEDQHQFSDSTSPTYMFACDNPMILVLAIPVMSFFTPVVEEVINRGLILHSLLPRGRTIAILSSAVLFAVLHRFETIPFAAVFGIFTATQMLHYRTLWAVAITHGTANLLIETSRICVDGFWMPGKLTWGPGSPEFLITLSLAACTIIAWWLAAHVEAGAEPAMDHPGCQ